MTGWVLIALALAVAIIGCGDGGPKTEAGRQRAAIVANLKAVEEGIESAADVSAAIKKYETANAEIQAFIEQFPISDEAKELAQMLEWLEGEVTRLKMIKEANQPPPPSPDFYRE